MFLAAFGGACASEDHNPSGLVSVIPVQYLPDQMRVLQKPSSLVTAYIAALTDLLVVDSVAVRDVARDALGSELSPKLYSKLLKHLDEYVLLSMYPPPQLIRLLHRVIRDITKGAGSTLTPSFALCLDQVT